MDVQPVGGAPATTAGSPVEPPAKSEPIEPATLPGGQSDAKTPLSDTIAKLFAGPSDSGPLHVSYRVEKPDEIITIFSDPLTGAEVAQFPAEAMVQMAQFFDKSSGITVDKDA
ncbi:MAG: hypothetical protein JO165_12560 [Candidatus Eremiobacteraeota bacterium]|nr:hypothetical protein [Candidatus Eremiobacteraeota bacterium]